MGSIEKRIGALEQRERGSGGLVLVVRREGETDDEAIARICREHGGSPDDYSGVVVLTEADAKL